MLDRDGTLIRHVPYLHDPIQVELLPTVREGVDLLRDAGCRLYLHTNQSGIGRGHFTLRDAEACNASLVEALGFGETGFSRVCIAPESPDDMPVYRKPSPRFGRELLAASGDEPVTLCYIGDNICDLQTADALGCLGIGVDTGGHRLIAQVESLRLSQASPIFPTFLDAARFVVTYDP